MNKKKTRIVTIDPKLCIGCITCQAASPKGFVLKNGLSHCLDPNAEGVEEATNLCPVRAITISESKED